MLLMDIMRQKTLEIILTKSFGCLYHSDSFMNAVEDKVHRHSASAEYQLELTGCAVFTKVENVVRKIADNIIDPPHSKTASSSKASDDCSAAQSGLRHQWKRRTRETTHRCKGRKSKREQSRSSSLPFSDDETENTTSESDMESQFSKRDRERRFHTKHKQGNGLEVIYTVNNLFQRALVYNTYWPGIKW